MKILLFFIFSHFTQAYLLDIPSKRYTYRPEVSSFVQEYILNSNFRLNEWNRLIPRLNELLYQKERVKPWSSREIPFWLRMANQALYLEYDKHKNEQKLLIKLDMAKKIPFIKTYISKCLSNPWSNSQECNFETLDKYIQLICLIENVSSFRIERFFRYPNVSALEGYENFCWIIYAINYLEQCQLNMFTEELNCGLTNVDLFIKLVLKRIEMSKQDILFAKYKPIYEYYFEIFKERSMQSLAQLLILFNNLNRISAKNINRNMLNTLNYFELKLNLEKLLNFLVNEYAEKLVKTDLGYKFENKQNRFQILSNVIDKKIRSLVNNSLRIILKHVMNLIKILNT